MPASNFNLRNIPLEVMDLLKKEANQKKISVNSLILTIIEHGLGITSSKKKAIFHDLDHLAGTWSAEDEKEFDDNVKVFEKIDHDFWI